MYFPLLSQPLQKDWQRRQIGPRTIEICILYIGRKAGILASWNLYIGILLCEISILIQEFCYIAILKLVYWYIDWFSKYIGFLKSGILVYQIPWSRTLQMTTYATMRFFSNFSWVTDYFSKNSLFFLLDMLLFLSQFFGCCQPFWSPLPEGPDYPNTSSRYQGAEVLYHNWQQPLFPLTQQT